MGVFFIKIFLKMPLEDWEYDKLLTGTYDKEDISQLNLSLSEVQKLKDCG